MLVGVRFLPFVDNPFMVAIGWRPLKG